MMRSVLPPITTLTSILSLVALIACGPSSSGTFGDGDGDGDGKCTDALSCDTGEICDPNSKECIADKPCTVDDECGVGGNCSNGKTCEVSTTGTACTTDTVCARGEACIGATADSTGLCGCDGNNFAPEPVAPNMLIVLDRSGSMRDNNKWTNAKAAIEQLMTDLAAEIRFGLAMYPTDNDCAVDPGNNGFNIPVKLGNGANIVAATEANAANPNRRGNTPLHKALRNAVNDTSLEDPNRPSYVIAITDGAPNCVSDAQARVLAEVDNLFNKQIKTFVIGFGNGVEPTNLNQMAEKGGTALPGNTKYYQANNSADLEQAFAAIGGQVIACQFTLEADDKAQIAAAFDGMSIAEDPVNGWTYDKATKTITFNGTSCDALRAGQVDNLVVANSCPVTAD